MTSKTKRQQTLVATQRNATAKRSCTSKFTSKLLAAAILTTAFSVSAQAADGCKFLLCMGAPNPMGISECTGTIKEVLRDLRKGKGLPTCSLVSSSTGGTAGSSYVSYRRAPLTPSCPDGTIQGQVGVVYHQGRKPDNLTKYSNIAGGATTNKHVIYVGKSETRLETGDYSSRACVSGQDYGQFTTGGYWRGGSRDDDSNYVPSKTHQWYEKVVIMTPDGADYEFDVTIDGKPHSRHRFSL